MKVCAASPCVCGADEGDARPAHAVEELGGGDLGAPHRRLGVVARRLDELPAQADEDALGHEHGAEPDQQLARRRPEHGAHGDDDGEQRGGDGGGQLVPHEHHQELVFELRLAARFVGELFARLLHAAGRAPLAVGSCRGGSCASADARPDMLRLTRNDLTDKKARPPNGIAVGTPPRPSKAGLELSTEIPNGAFTLAPC